MRAPFHRRPGTRRTLPPPAPRGATGSLCPAVLLLACLAAPMPVAAAAEPLRHVQSEPDNPGVIMPEDRPDDPGVIVPEDEGPDLPEGPPPMAGPDDLAPDDDAPGDDDAPSDGDAPGDGDAPDAPPDDDTARTPPDALDPDATAPDAPDRGASGSDAADAQNAAPGRPPLPDDLDGLFARLKRERDAGEAKRITRRIWRLWGRSGDASVDLLTMWATRAMNRKRYAMALDILDQVTTVKPDFAEGWNKRATLHFMQREYLKSLADIERTLELEPRHFGALAGAGTILTALDRKPEALKVWYRALNVYPSMKSAQEAVSKLEEELAGRGI